MVMLPKANALPIKLSELEKLAIKQSAEDSWWDVEIFLRLNNRLPSEPLDYNTSKDFKKYVDIVLDEKVFPTGKKYHYRDPAFYYAHHQFMLALARGDFKKVRKNK